MIYNCAVCNDFAATDVYPHFCRHMQSVHGEGTLGHQSFDATGSTNADETLDDRRCECAECRQRFLTCIEVKTHVEETHPTTYRPVRCKHCPTGFKLRIGLKLHMTEKHPEELDQEIEKKLGNMVQCAHCDRKFRSRSTMLKHIRVVHLNKRDCYECPEIDCDKSYSSKSKLTLHLDKVHDKNLSVVMSKAKAEKEESKKIRKQNRDAAKKRIEDFFKSMQVEMKRVDGKLLCIWEGCSFTAKHPNKVKLHVEMVHLKLKPFKCEICEKDGVRTAAPHFSTQAHLQSHIDAIHRRLRPFVCEHCGWRFTRKNNLAKHIKRSRGRCHPGKRLYYTEEKTDNEDGVVKCETCNMTFSRRCNLEAHIKTQKGRCIPGARMHKHSNTVYAEFVEPDDPREIFKCDECSRVYPYRQSLRQHKQRVHGDGSSLFVCEECGKSFTQKHRLTCHQANAHGQHKLMPNLCNVCGKRFITSFSLRRHLADVHNKLAHEDI